jgi:hypothetical protein
LGVRKTHRELQRPALTTSSRWVLLHISIEIGVIFTPRSVEF